MVPFEGCGYVGMGVSAESDNKDMYNKTYSHTHAPTHSHTWRDDEATKFDDWGLC